VAYYDVNNDALKYASCDANCTTASNWTKVAIDTTGNVGQYASLAMDSNKPRITYYDATNKDLKYASCDANCTTASNWAKVAIDTTGNVGQYTSLVLDSSKPRVAYYDVNNDALKYASCDANCTTASNWTKVAVDSAGNVGQYASLAMDANKPRIAYYDNTNNIFRYASCDVTCATASNWTKIAVDSTTNRGQYTSLGIDSSKPRASYYDVTNGDFRYASCDTTCTTAGNWTKIILDSTGNVGQYSSTNR
ncbi:MAG: hypothetical protein AAB899_02365, partial [Patescibacteria group bacterium]